MSAPRPPPPFLRAPRALLLLLAGLALLAPSCGSGRTPRTVVVVVVDTLRRDALGCYGAAGDPTPAIDALAREGTLFEQAISSSGWTLPAVSSLLTGTWPSVHHATGKKSLLAPISPDVATAAEVLHGAGFTTLAVANAAFLSPMLGLARGFDVFDHRHAFNHEIRRADASVAAALKLLEEHRGQDLFLLVHLFDAHLDYDPPQELHLRFSGGRDEPAPPLGFQTIQGMLGLGGKAPPSAEDAAYVRAVYEGEVAFVDAAVGRLVAGLERSGRYADTAFFLTADHGEELWDHGGFEHGHTLYDELVHVPLIVKLPAGREAHVARSDAQVRVLDLMPTVFDLHGIAPPASFQGESLLPLIHERTRASRPAFLESTLYGPDREGLRGERYKYLVLRLPDGGTHEELYDWRTDPGERHDLARERPDLLQELRAQHGEWRGRLDAQASETRASESKEIRPETIEEYERSLRSLGYSGREDEHD